MYMSYLNLCIFSKYIIYQFYFFFFQAEDGIRDRNVTGVQTCALPIFQNSHANLTCSSCSLDFLNKSFVYWVSTFDYDNHEDRKERRVGKECRFRWSPDD